MLVGVTGLDHDILDGLLHTVRHAGQVFLEFKPLAGKSDCQFSASPALHGARRAHSQSHSRPEDQIVFGHGFAGMRERLAAAGGELTISSPPGGPTQLAATIPLLLDRGEPAVVIP